MIRPAPKYAAAASSMNPIICLNSSENGPVRGKRLASSGVALRIRYGSAIPTPTISIAGTPRYAGWVDAHSNSGGSSGAVQGVARIAVNAPKMTFPPTVSCRGSTL